MNSWRDVMSDEAYKAFGASPERTPEVGQRPALLVIDVVTAFLGEEGLSLADSIADRPLSCGNAVLIPPRMVHQANSRSERVSSLPDEARFSLGNRSGESWETILQTDSGSFFRLSQ